ncbi:MAG: UvrD-helicase domain-containing protein [Bacteroidales bacterium]|nr:UvrD-helicase domain-containing protein [Bacteroidales bacterium]
MENRSSVILEGLNSEQKAAVSCVDGPVLIVAGAGSGKTRVLTSRIAYILAEKNLDPARILALTFTKKAASEMKERIALMVGERRARRLYMGTFHSVFIRFLREFAESLGYPSTFTIYDTSDSVSAIKACLKELQLDDKVYKPKDVLSRISMAKNNLVTPAAYRRNAQAMQNDTAAKKPRIVDIYDLYAYKCKMAGVMDFDDILLNMNILLRDNPAALESVAGRFDYIMVDEYQDTNFSQYLILKKLSQFHKNICVVGDDSQSIYAFRGAKIENILNFKKDYPEHHIFRLEQNYRSTRVIVDAANSLIAKNSARIPKECYSMGEEGEKIRLIQAYTEKEEALQIAASIKSRIYSDSAQYQDFAVLYRTLNQSRVFEQIFRDKNIPCKVISGPPFLERSEVKDVLAFLKLFANYNDDEAFKRSILLKQGVGNTTLESLMEIAKVKGLSLYETLNLPDLEAEGIKSAALKKLIVFREEIKEFFNSSLKEDCYKFAVEVVTKYNLLGKYKLQNDVESLGRAGNVEELLNWIGSVSEELKYSRLEELYASGNVEDNAELSLNDVPPVTIGDFLENASLLSAVDSDEDGDNKVVLMTVHASKGLEFPYVYVAGMEENLFPSGGFMASEVEIEEERRLFYVAMTRAKRTLGLSFASTRFRNGKTESNSPSRFVREVDSQYIANPLTSAFDGDDDDDAGIGFGGWKKPFASRSGYSYGQSSRPQVERRPSASQPVRRPEPVRRSEPMPVRRPQAVPKRVPDADFVPTPILQLKAGQRIEHNRFGYGKILEISGSVTDLKAKIAFDDHGEKILILKYAKIRAVDLENN